MRSGDPVKMALEWEAHLATQSGESALVPFICAANDKRPGGDWETGVIGYEVSYHDSARFFLLGKYESADRRA